MAGITPPASEQMSDPQAAQKALQDELVKPEHNAEVFDAYDLANDHRYVKSFADKVTNFFMGVPDLILGPLGKLLGLVGGDKLTNGLRDIIHGVVSKMSRSAMHTLAKVLPSSFFETIDTGTNSMVEMAYSGVEKIFGYVPQQEKTARALLADKSFTDGLEKGAQEISTTYGIAPSVIKDAVISALSSTRDFEGLQGSILDDIKDGLAGSSDKDKKEKAAKIASSGAVTIYGKVCAASQKALEEKAGPNISNAQKHEIRQQAHAIAARISGVRLTEVTNDDPQFEIIKAGNEYIGIFAAMVNQQTNKPVGDVFAGLKPAPAAPVASTEEQSPAPPPPATQETKQTETLPAPAPSPAQDNGEAEKTPGAAKEEKKTEPAGMDTAQAAIAAEEQKKKNREALNGLNVPMLDFSDSPVTPGVQQTPIPPLRAAARQP